MDQNLPFSEPSKSFGIGPPPPDIVNPLDRLARRPRLAPHLTPPFPLPFSAPHLSAAQDTMSLNFAPPPRSKINSHNTSTSLLSDKHMKDSNESSLMNEQENVVVTDVIKREDAEEGAITSDGELPPPPPPTKQPAEEGEHSEEGECDSDPEEGELGDGQSDAKRKERRHSGGRGRRDGRARHSPRDNVIPLVKKNPGPPVPQLDPVQRKLERIASKQVSPYREPSYRDRNFRERGGDRGPERDDMHRNNGSGHEERGRFPPRDNRNLEKYNKSLDYRRDGRSMRPGDMPSLISLPPMPVISSSSKGKVPDFPPLSFGASAGLPPPIPPMIPPVPGAGWPPPPGPMGLMPGRHERGKGDSKIDDAKMKESFDMYHKAWESYYSGMGKDRPKSSRDKPHSADRRSRSPELRDRFSAPPPASGSHHPPGMPGPFPGMIPGMVPGMPPHLMPRSRSKESAWERGLKVSKKIRDEVRRNEKSDEESDDSHPGMKLQSKIVMKEHKTKSRSPSIPKGKSTRRLSPLSDGDSGQHYHPRLTPERYRGAYERRPAPEEMKKTKAAYPGGDAAWHDPWMRPNSPKDRKRQLSRSSSSSDSSSNGSDSSQRKRLQELKRHIAIDLAHRRMKAKKDAAKLKRLKEKLSPSEFELLTRKRVKRFSDSASKSKHDSNSDSDSDDSSSSSSSAGSISPGTYAGKLADSPTSPVSSPDFNYKDNKKTKEILIRQLQKVEKQLEKKKKDEKRRHS